MSKFEVSIKEVHDVVVIVELPEGATRDEITDAAEEAHGNADNLSLEYNRTLAKDDWTVVNAETGRHL